MPQISAQAILSNSRFNTEFGRDDNRHTNFTGRLTSRMGVREGGAGEARSKMY
jgi:hypothetical protein